MTSRERLVLLTVWLAAFGLAPAYAQQAVDLVTAEKLDAPIKSGVDELRRALEKRGARVRLMTSRPSADTRIVVGRKGDEAVDSMANRSAVPDKPESYSISVDKRSIVVEGSDATGAMYGALDLAEQIASQAGKDVAAGLKPVSKSPFLDVRGINMFLTVQDIDDAGGAFWSDEYWNTYFETMARNRYNLLDIHGPCDAVTLTFPNGFSYFVSLPEFPEVGVGAERATKNLARFRQVVQMAADRGIKVGYMNYEAPPPIGPWKTRRFGVDERWVDPPQEFLQGPRLEQYTRDAVASFLKQLPELWMFGFRIGESGQPEDFYQKTYLAALADAPSSLRIYLRTWIAGPQNVRALVDASRHPVFIEPKYNGEQLGLPYQAVLGGREYPPSGSFEDYTTNPKKYSILWQIRAHGTHRVFHWGDPDFARRTARSCKLGGGVGFSMEPMEAYLPAADYLHNNPKTDHGYYKWMVERQWIWHLIWGRTAYDPDVPDQVFVNAFVSRFGAQAGPVVFKALVESSKIVPFVYSYHNVGLDHQQFAPEFENGDHAFAARLRLWQGTRLVPYGGNNDDFLRIDTLDRTAMASPATYVENRLRGEASGAMGPFEASAYLDAAASTSERLIDEAARLNPGSPKNFDCIRQDVEATAWLGRYYRDRIRSITHYAFYRRTNDHQELTQASDDLRRAVADWDRLSDVTEAHFGSVPEYIRLGVKDFRWRDEGRGLGVDLDQIDNLEASFKTLPRPGAYGQYSVVVGHTPPERAQSGQPLRLTVTYGTAAERPHVFVFSKSAQETAFTKTELMRENEFQRTWTSEIPAARVVPGEFEYYFEVNSDRWGNYGSTSEHQPPYRVRVADGRSKPVISYAPPTEPIRAASLPVTVSVESAANVKAVFVYYKRMPSYHEFVRMEMQPGGGGRYTASVPLTPEGLFYYFEAIDVDGGATHYPNFQERTPRFEIESWDPAQAGR